MKEQYDEILNTIDDHNFISLKTLIKPRILKKNIPKDILVMKNI